MSKTVSLDVIKREKLKADNDLVITITLFREESGREYFVGQLYIVEEEDGYFKEVALNLKGSIENNCSWDEARKYLVNYIFDQISFAFMKNESELQEYMKNYMKEFRIKFNNLITLISAGKYQPEILENYTLRSGSTENGGGWLCVEHQGHAERIEDKNLSPLTQEGLQSLYIDPVLKAIKYMLQNIPTC